MTDKDKFISANDKKYAAYFGGATGISAFVLSESPVLAQTSGVSEINSMVASLGTLAGTVTAVVLGAMIVRLGIKFVNRMTVKG